MSIDELRNEAVAMTRWERHRFFIFIAGVTLIAMFLVSVSMSLYNNSGAAQLDFSRPSYQDVRNQAKRDTTGETFPSSGVLDNKALDKFATMYTERKNKVTVVNSFGPEPLSEESLQLLGTTRPQDPATVPLQDQ